MPYAELQTKLKSLLGFFVKYGDGGVDLEPIANCYKMQVYRLAELLGIDTAGSSHELRARTPGVISRRMKKFP